MANTGVFLSLSMVCFGLSSLFFKEASSCTNCKSVNVTCVDGECLPRCVNVTSSGECFQCRDSMFYGKQCENDCPHSCLNSRCQLINSRVECTKGCVASKKGDNCGVNCPASCTECERYDDRCRGACKSPKYYGDKCSQVCPSNCNGTCDRNNGTCNRCKRGFKGRFCNDSCHTACTQCERYGYICIGNCSSALYYGDQCNKLCPTHCEDGCDKDTGECNGCKSSYLGAYCNESCSSICNRGCESGACINCTADCIGLRTRNVHPGNQLGTVWVVLLVAVFSGAIVFTSILLWRSRRSRRRVASESVQALDMNDVMNSKWSKSQSLCALSTSEQCPRFTSPSCVLTAEDSTRHDVQICDELLGDNSINQMIFEFQKLPAPNIRETKCGSQEENLGKNRYKDVLPFDETRVALESDGEDASDYVNASYINGYRNQIRYVAAQGPTPKTIDDFWRMIWQLNSTKIVMLTNLVEAEKAKCAMYWPSYPEIQQYGNVCVQCMEDETCQDYTIRTLTVCKGTAEARTVRQFHFTTWPDHGVPEETESIINFHRLVKGTGHSDLGPMVIHCSAGVGRTGTFIAFDYLLDQASDGGRMCVYKCVCELRLQRMKIVQTKIQYKFLYDLLLDALQYHANTPSHVHCESCWDKDNKAETLEVGVRVEESDFEIEDSENASLLPDVCILMNEKPDFFKTEI